MTDIVSGHYKDGRPALPTHHGNVADVEICALVPCDEREGRLGKISATELHFFPNITTVIDNIITKKGISYLITDWKLLLITVTALPRPLAGHVAVPVFPRQHAPNCSAVQFTA